MSQQLAPPLDLSTLPPALPTTPPRDSPEREILHDDQPRTSASPPPSPLPPHPHSPVASRFVAAGSRDPEVDLYGNQSLPEPAGPSKPPAHGVDPAVAILTESRLDPEVKDGKLDLPAPAGPAPPPHAPAPVILPRSDDPEVKDGRQDLPRPAGPPAPTSAAVAPSAVDDAAADDPEVTASGTLDLPEPAGPDMPSSVESKVPFDHPGSTNATQVNEEGQATKKHAPQDKIPSLPSAAEIPTHPAGGKVVPHSLEVIEDLQKKSTDLPPFIQRAEEAIVSLLPVDMPSDLNLEAAPPPAYALNDGHKDPNIAGAHHDVPGKTHDQVDVVEKHEEGAEIEKRKALRREVLGHEAGGTVVLGIEDDHLWTMLRRLDKQVTHVLSPPSKLKPGQPDLRRSRLPTVPYNSDLIRANLERCYATAGVGGIRFTRELGRLISWHPNERVRAGIFAATYFVAWVFHMTTPLLIGVLMLLILSRRSRSILFPVVPPPPGVTPSATDPLNRKGDESMVSTRHPQKVRSKHEQIEEQSWEFTKNIEKFGMRVLMGGRHKPSNKQLKKAAVEAGEDPDNVTNGTGHADVEAQTAPATGVEHGSKRNKTLNEGGKLEDANADDARKAKEERDQMVGIVAKGLQDALNDFADLWEMIANALNPPAYYPPGFARLKLAAVLLPVAIIFAITPPSVFAHAGSFALGAGFFGAKFIMQGVQWLLKTFPNWPEQLDLSNSILIGVPTDAQLALYMLRQREFHRNPLPRPPYNPSSKAAQEQLNDTSVLDDAHEEDTVSSVGSGYSTHLVGDGEHHEGGSTKNKILSWGQKLSGKAATLRAHGKVTVLPEGPPKKQEKQKISMSKRVTRYLLDRKELKDGGEIGEYPAKLNGKLGSLILDVPDEDEGSTFDTQLLFIPDGAKEPTESIHVNNVVELKKGGVGLPRSVLGWAAGMDLAGNGLEIRVKDAGGIQEGKQIAPGVWVNNVIFEDEGDQEQIGRVIQFERVGRRDALFVRLLSISEALWETL